MDDAAVLRLTHSSHRSEGDVRAELDWIDYLVSEGVPIPGCYLSRNGKKTEVVEVGDSFFIAFLYYSLSWGIPESYGGDKHSFAADFVRTFWEGYRTEYALDSVWLERLPLFLKLRDITLYLVLAKKIEPADRNERINRWMAEIRDRLWRNVPIVELDYSSFNCNHINPWRGFFIFLGLETHSSKLLDPGNRYINEVYLVEVLSYPC